MTEPTADTYYTPERIDRILREWPRYESQAENCRSTLPDALRPAHGNRADPLVWADVRADVERAMVMSLRQWSLEWNTVDHVRRGYSLNTVATTLRLRKADVLAAYERACLQMATYLGWIAPREPEVC